jgi:tRNA (guanine-N7-)-methyltransferase
LLERIRIHPADARGLIEALPDASLGRVFLLFPDPWPKKRHHKRRFIQMDTLNALARVMKPGAEFRFASDDAGYVAWTFEHVLAHEGFAWMAERPQDWLARPDDWPITRYEQKALHGMPSFVRFARAAAIAPDLQTPAVQRK